MYFYNEKGVLMSHCIQTGVVISFHNANKCVNESS